MCGECDKCGEHCLECRCDEIDVNIECSTDWIKISEEKPRHLEEVLVCQDFYDPDAPNCFVATYWERDNEWNIHHHFSNDRSYMRISIPINDKDKWFSFNWPDKEE